MSEQSPLRSKDVARQRLLNVLMNDRNGLSRADLNQMRADIEGVVASYMTVNGCELELVTEQAQGKAPVRRLVFRAEVGAALRMGKRVDDIP